MPDTKFSDLIRVQLPPLSTTAIRNQAGLVPPRPEILVAGEGGNTMEAAEQYKTNLDSIQKLMTEAGLSTDKDVHAMVGAGVREPIRILARYKAWTNTFFTDWTLDPADDNRIPLDQPIGTAFISSVEGRAFRVTPGVQLWTRPTFFETKAGLEIFWATLKTAGWPILRRRMEETSDEMARRLDVKAKVLLDAAITASGQTVSASSFTKTALDTVIKNSHLNGFPVTQGAINPYTLMNMTTWTNVGSSQFPFFWAPESAREQVYRQLYAEGYGNIRWTISYNIPTSTIYLGGEPAEIGYHQNHGAATSASDVDIELGKDRHFIRQEDAYYIGNNYNLWTISLA